VCQAEDGIRDATVTGVQTCALPISARRRRVDGGPMSEIRVPILDLRAQLRTIEAEVRAALDRVVASQHFILGPEVEGFEREIARSEERRVGKEGRAREYGGDYERQA